MQRRRFLSMPLAAPLVHAQRTPPKQNILVLIADDLGLHTGAYGDATARTPHLDRLANEGVRFTNAYCTTASCSASRSVIFTGLHNHANGQYGHAHVEHHMSLMPHVRPMPALVKAAGYRTGMIGKFHVAPPAQFAWDYRDESRSRDVASMADRAKSFISAAGSAPWYLHVGYSDPHRAAKGFANDARYPGVTKNAFDPASLHVPSFLPDNAAVRGELAQYYEAANRMDQGIGMMLDMLRETGQLQNTLILFLSDNGIPFPNAKTNLYDAGSRLPFILRLPGGKRGLVNNSMISYTDIAPTLLEWAGAPLPDYPLHGSSFLADVEKENAPGRDQVFYSHTFHEITMYYPVRGTRTRQYKYLRNLYPELTFPHASDLWESPTWQSVARMGDSGRVGRRPAQQYLHRPAEELYDVTKDPDEIDNLAAVASMKPVLEKLRLETQQFRRRTNDPWLINDREGPFANLG
jgi:N-sulfoglucosamine sulfohydrolase